MEFMYKPDDYEAKLIVFYAIKNLNKSPSYAILSQVISSGVAINYFELQEYLQAVIDIGSVEESEVGGERVYSLTTSGIEACEYFSQRIPPSVRDKIANAASEVNNDKSAFNKVYADYIPINEEEYKVVCGIMENNVKLLDFEMYAGPKSRAKKICEYFKNHTQDFYMNIVADIENHISNKQEE